MPAPAAPRDTEESGATSVGDVCSPTALSPRPRKEGIKEKLVWGTPGRVVREACGDKEAVSKSQNTPVTPTYQPWCTHWDANKWSSSSRGGASPASSLPEGHVLVRQDLSWLVTVCVIFVVSSSLLIWVLSTQDQEPFSPWNVRLIFNQPGVFWDQLNFSKKWKFAQFKFFSLCFMECEAKGGWVKWGAGTPVYNFSWQAWCPWLHFFSLVIYLHEVAWLLCSPFSGQWPLITLFSPITLITILTLVTLVTLFQSTIQF